MKSGLAFHVHHDNLWEWCDDYDGRVEYIRKKKAQGEQELRLRLFRLIPPDRIPGKDNPLWEAYSEAREASEKVREAYIQTWEAYCKAWKALYKAIGAEIEALHKELCPDCPWNDWTIFPEVTERGAGL